VQCVLFSHLFRYFVGIDDRWQDFYIFLVIFVHCACCFLRVLGGHSEVVKEKNGEDLCMLNLS